MTRPAYYGPRHAGAMAPRGMPLPFFDARAMGGPFPIHQGVMGMCRALT